MSRSVHAHQVHGLLGQRAISPAPMVQLPVQQPGGNDEQSKLDALTSTTFATVLDLGGGGVGTSTNMFHAAVQVDGHLQGEGAIEGSYRDYQVGARPRSLPRCVFAVLFCGAKSTHVPCLSTPVLPHQT